MPRDLLSGRAALVVALVALAACGPDDESIDDARTRCTGEQTQPLTVSEVRAGLARHGYRMHPARCTAPGAAWQLGNIELDGGGDPERQDAEHRARGSVGCEGFARTDGGSVAVRRKKWPGDRETYFDVANVVCWIFPHEDAEEEHVSRFERALRDVAESNSR